MAPSRNRQSHTEQTQEEPSHSQSPHDNGEILLTSHQPPSLNDLRSVAADIKDTLTVAMMAAISDLRIDIQSIAGRVQEVEKMTASETIRKAQK